jgi:high affinity Mn2+ porin
MKNYKLLSFLLIKNVAFSQDTSQVNKRYTLHAQETTVSQYRPKFKAAYTGHNSQVPENEWGTTITSSIFAGLKLWNGAQIFINPEIAGGHGLSSAFGIAAFPNGEAFRVGNPDPTIYIARAYFKQLFALSSTKKFQGDEENKIAQFIPESYLAFTVGKISIADYFDDNAFSHNPRSQFLSWGLMSNGAWDYPANTRGYTPSMVLEFISKKIELRFASCMMPKSANGNDMDLNITKANANTFEIKYKYKLNKQQGKISALTFYNTAFMGSYSSTNILSTPDSLNPNFYRNEYTIIASRQYGRSKYGGGINLEQNLTNNIGIFARASYNDGKNETWAFTEIDRAFSIGTLINGAKWKRNNDKFGLAYCISGLSQEHMNYLAKGGLGFIIGDGKLNYSNEHLFETFYSASFLNGLITPSLVYQLVINPAYKKDRGPINIYSIRMHFSI